MSCELQCRTSSVCRSKKVVTPSNFLIARFKSALTNVACWFAITISVLAVLLYCQFLTRAPSIYQWWPEAFPLLTGFLLNALVSFLIYYLGVALPGHRKKKVIKSNLQRTYASIKEDILWQIVFASKKGGRHDLSTGSDEVRDLLHIDAFKAAFEKGKLGDEGFYAFENQMSSESDEFKEIIICFQLLQRQIDFALQNYEIFDQRVFDFFARLGRFLQRAQHFTPGYDESKPLCIFIWQIFAGFEPNEGYTGYDVIQKFIDEM